jgi:hypothetical protein
MKKKAFDCVQMKHDIQQAILAEMRGMSPAEQRKKTEEIIACDPLLARFWKQRRSSADRAGQDAGR